MKTLKYKGESYRVCAPRPSGEGKYTCNAWKARTGREIRNTETLDDLAKIWFKAKGGM